MRTLKRLLFMLIHSKIARDFLHLYYYGYLYERGWVSSYRIKRPVDKNNKPLPWATYPFISFITERLTKNMLLFEYGSGNSTLYYSQYVDKVMSVENDKEWYEQLVTKIPNNAQLYFEELKYGGKYSEYAKTCKTLFDIIIVDGRDRINCMKNAAQSLNKKGVIVLDNSEREAYKDGMDFLLNKGYKKIDFWGIVPGINFETCTTIFYPKDNCLNI